jgi:hypothetical protein
VADALIGPHQIVEVESWEDERDDPPADEWPYPDSYVRHRVTGALARDVQAKLGTDADVMILERVESGGYSEYTQENYYSFTIQCGGQEILFAEDWSGSPFTELLKWLEKE